ncbi:MAG: endonuclease III [Zetaproteobacteria bacterium]|nr:MAG: endonuclease III [Zetaproteobacteria bacterium]
MRSGEREQPWDPATVRALFDRLAEERPEPKTELVYHNPFTLLVAVVLSAQSTDVAVNKATGPLFAVADTPEKMARLGVEGIKPFIASIGLYNNKARHIHALSVALIERFDGVVPDDRAALMSLPGVGRKTANVVLNVLFDRPTMAVDTHVFRVSNRIGLARGKTPLAVERGLLRVIPECYLRCAHHWLILHGRYVCTARRPKCDRCVIRDLCRWPEKGEV